MANLQADSILDEVLITQKELGRGKFTDISYTLQKHVAMSVLLQEKKVTEDSGIGLQWNVMVGTSGNAKRTGLFATDSVNQADVMKQASAPWTHYTSSAIIERRQLAMNRAPAAIVERIQFATADALTDLAKLFERDFWATHPGSTTTDQLFGVPYWVVWTDNSGTNPNGGFDGGDPANFSSGAGGIASASVSGWQNWCAKYTSMTKTDGIKKMREAATKCNFMPPVQTPNYGSGAPSLGYYAPYTVITALETAAESQNDNLGNSLDSKDGAVLFRRVPVTYVPALDAKAGSPVYGIDWDQFNIGVLAGENLRESPWAVSGTSHTTLQKFIDISLNTRCYNRRAHFVLATTTVA